VYFNSIIRKIPEIVSSLNWGLLSILYEGAHLQNVGVYVNYEQVFL
jgi:hypothetical protein